MSRKSDDQVLERLPLAAADPDSARVARAARGTRPSQPDTDRSRSADRAPLTPNLAGVKGDPRFAGYAQAALAKWWATPIRLPKCCCSGRRCASAHHDFDAALAGPDGPHPAQSARRAGAADARDDSAGAGEITTAAAADCAALRRLAPEIVWAACAYGLGGVNGRLRESYEALNALLAGQPAAATRGPRLGLVDARRDGGACRFADDAARRIFAKRWRLTAPTSTC
jgi:hypothetical protein